jgi:hypothetical protein
MHSFKAVLLFCYPVNRLLFIQLPALHFQMMKSTNIFNKSNQQVGLKD